MCFDLCSFIEIRPNYTDKSVLCKITKSSDLYMYGFKQGLIFFNQKENKGNLQTVIQVTMYLKYFA